MKYYLKLNLFCYILQRFYCLLSFLPFCTFDIEVPFSFLRLPNSYYLLSTWYLFHFVVTLRVSKASHFFEHILVNGSTTYSSYTDLFEAGKVQLLEIPDKDATYAFLAWLCLGRPLKNSRSVMCPRGTFDSPKANIRCYTRHPYATH